MISASMIKNVRVCRLIRTRELALCSLLIGCSLPMQILADDLDKLFKLSLQELTQTPITGSTLRAENIERVPSAVTVFNQAHLKASTFSTLDEILNIVPGFQSYRSSSAALHPAFSSRGRRISAGSAEVLVIVDGVRYEATNLAGAAIALAKYPLSFIDRVEFIRGPGGAIYGSNAMLGVINIATRQNQRELHVSLGNNNQKELSWLGNTQWQDWNFDAAVFWHQDHGSLMDTPEANGDSVETARDPYRKGNINLKAQRGNTKLLAQYDYASEDDFYVTSVPVSDYNFANYKTFNVALNQKIETTSIASNLQLAFGHTSWNSGAQLLPTGALLTISNPASAFPLVQNYDFGDQNQWQLLWHAELKTLETGHLSWGTEYRVTDNQRVDVSSNYDTLALASGSFPITYYDDFQLVGTTIEAQKRDIFGAYAQYQRSMIDDSLHLTLGGRFDHVASVGEQLSPRLGMVYDIADHHHFKLLYGKAFRAPTDGELGFEDNPVVRGNSALNPESVQTWDAIWHAQWPTTQFTVGYFENRFDDAIVQVFNPAIGLEEFNNIEQDPVKGLEIETRWKLTRHWSAYAAYTHFTDQPELSFKETDTIGSLVVSYKKQNWRSSLTGVYSGSRLRPPDASQHQIEIDRYWLLHFNASYRIQNDLEVQLKVKNVLDKYYLAPANVASNVKLIPGRGREWQLGLLWRY